MFLAPMLERRVGSVAEPDDDQLRYIFKTMCFRRRENMRFDDVEYSWCVSCAYVLSISSWLQLSTTASSSDDCFHQPAHLSSWLGNYPIYVPTPSLCVPILR